MTSLADDMLLQSRPLERRLMHGNSIKLRVQVLMIVRPWLRVRLQYHKTSTSIRTHPKGVEMYICKREVHVLFHKFEYISLTKGQGWGSEIFLENRDCNIKSMF